MVLGLLQKSPSSLSPFFFLPPPRGMSDYPLKFDATRSRERLVIGNNNAMTIGIVDARGAIFIQARAVVRTGFVKSNAGNIAHFASMYGTGRFEAALGAMASATRLQEPFTSNSGFRGLIGRRVP